MIPLFKVFMSEDVIEPVNKVLRSGYVTQGKQVEKYEDALEIINKGLDAKYESFHYYFSINKVSALIGLEDYKESIKEIDKALKVYPKNHKLLYFNSLCKICRYFQAFWK